MRDEDWLIVAYLAVAAFIAGYLTRDLLALYDRAHSEARLAAMNEANQILKALLARGREDAT